MNMYLIHLPHGLSNFSNAVANPQHIHTYKLRFNLTTTIILMCMHTPPLN